LLVESGRQRLGQRKQPRQRNSAESGRDQRNEIASRQALHGAVVISSRRHCLYQESRQ